MKLRRYLTLAVDIELPDGLDDAETDVLIDEVFGCADLTLEFDNGDGSKILDFEIQTYSDEEPV